MKMPVKTILWEQWRVTRKAFLITLFFGLCGGAMSWIKVNPEWYNTFRDMGTALTLISLVGFGVFLLLDYHSGNNLRLGCSTHQWTLPVNRRRFTAFYLAYRMLALVALCMLTLPTLYTVRHFSEAREIILLGLCLQAFGFAVLWPLEKRLIAPYILLAAGFGCFYVCIRRGGMEHLSRSPLELGITITAFVVLCLAAAMRSALTLDKRPFSLARILHLPESDRIYWPGHFVSGYKAQSWSEWRQHGLFMPRSVLFTTLLVVIWTLVVGAFTLPHAWISMAYLFPIAMPVSIVSLLALYTVLPSALLTGVFPLNQDTRAARSRRSPFVFTLPLATRDLAVARLVTAFRSALLASAVVIGFFVAVHLIIWTTGLHFAFWPVYELISAEADTQSFCIWMTLMLIGGFLLAWSLYCSMIPFFVLLIGNLIPTLALSTMGDFGMLNGKLIEFLTLCSVIGFSSIVIVGGAIYFGRRAWKQNLLPRNVILFFTHSVLVIMLVLVLAWSFSPQNHLNQNEILFIIALLINIACVPAMVAYFQASWLQWVRHR